MGMHEETYLEQKIWGCLADVIPVCRYDYLIGTNDTRKKLYLEIDERRNLLAQIQKEFGVMIDIGGRRKIKPVIKRIENELIRRGVV